MAVLRLVVVVLVAVTAVTVKAIDKPLIPDIWLVVENSYDSRVTINFPGLYPGVGMLVDELYDITKEQGMVEVTDHSKIHTTNYYSKTNQAFVVTGDQCSVGTIVQHDGYNLFGWLYDDTASVEGDKNNFLYGPSALLRIPRDYSKTSLYIGQTEIRGIMADHWVIEHRLNYTLDYYFAAEQWLMPYGHYLDGIDLRAPLQVTVNGMEGNPWKESEHDFMQTITYDFTEFKPYIEPVRNYMFLVKTGVDCKLRETLDPDMDTPPDAPSTFQVFFENIVHPEEHSTAPPLVFRAWMYYDSWKKLVRVDVNPDMDADMGSKSYRSIHDYNTGINYVIYADGKCEMSTLQPHDFGNMIGSSVIGGIIMDDSNSFFHLDDKYVFSGYDETRGLKATRWTATRDDIYNPESHENFKKVVVDYQFTSPNTVLDGELDRKSMPARIDVAVYRDDNTTAVLHRGNVNLLHMQSSIETYQFNPFHVGECFDYPTQRTWVKITFAGDWYHGASQHPGQFKNDLVNMIAMSTHTSYIRMPEVQLDHDTEMVFATLLLLEPAPYHLEFFQVEKRSPTVNDAQIKFNVNDEDVCAWYCLTYTKFECKSFYECSGLGKNCYLSNYEDSPGQPAVNKKCDHYTRALNHTTVLQLPNIDIVGWIMGEIIQGKFSILIDYTDNDGQMQVGEYVGFAVTDEILGDDPILADLLKDDFHVASRHNRLKGSFTELQTTTSYVTCMMSCDTQLAFECETFSYCYDNSECRLSSHVVSTPVNKDDIVGDTDCVIITRRHTDDYTVLNGLVYLGEPTATDTAVDPEKCAYLCDTADTFTCRSFDFCYHDLSCNMYEQHTVDAPDNMFNTSAGNCLHYSRQAMVDFVKHDNQVLEGSRDRYIKDITVYMCAQTCEDEPDFGCNGFDYCTEKNGTTCFLTADHYSDQGVDINNSPVCDHYSREYYEGQDRNTYVNNRKTKYIYSPGDMAALGCSMLVISICLSFGGVYLYNKKS